jgi:Protein of unknown function (DUF4199)
MKRIVLVFGLIAGGLLSVMMVLTLALLQNTKLGHSYFLGYTTMVLAFLMVYFGIRSYRDNVGAGVISYWRGFAIGISITLIGCVCYVATWEIVYRKFAPDFYEKYAATIVDGARAKGATEAQLAAKKAQVDKQMAMYKDPFLNVAFTFIEPLPVGLLFSLASAGILRRKRRSAGGQPAADGVVPSIGR